MFKKAQCVGFTLTEMMVVVAIIGILAGIAVPSYNQMLERRRLVSATEAVLADLRWARSESIKRNARVRLTFTTTGGTWSYVIHPDGTDATDTNNALKQENSASFSGISVVSNRDFFSFDNIRGVTGTNGTVTLTSSPSNFQTQVVVSPLGRVRACAVGGGIGGYAAC